MDETFQPETSICSQFSNQRELNDFIRDLGLITLGVGLLASKFNEWNLLSKVSRLTVYRGRKETFDVYFEMSEDLCSYIDINGLFTAIVIDHDPKELWLLIHSLTKKKSKFALLRNRNQHPSLITAYSVQMKEEYDNVEGFLQLI